VILVLAKEVLPADKVLVTIVAPVTFNVLLKVVAPPTFAVEVVLI
jgi:hypothetical protein